MAGKRRHQQKRPYLTSLPRPWELYRKLEIYLSLQMLKQINLKKKNPRYNFIKISETANCFNFQKYDDRHP